MTASREAEAEALVSAIHSGDVEAVIGIVTKAPELAREPLGGPFKTRTALHIVCDWPGYFPHGPQIVPVLIAAGADPNYRDPEPGSETPLHWAASSDDVDVAAALIDGGADIELPEGSIGTPLDNAIGYACWHVARLLVARGARVDKLWHAGALGLLDRLEELLAANPTPEDVSQGLWHGLRRRAASRRRTAPGRRGRPELATELRSWDPARRRRRDRHAPGERHRLAQSERSPLRRPTPGLNHLRSLIDYSRRGVKLTFELCADPAENFS